LRFIDWIWHVRGSLAVAPEQSNEDTFDKLAPLFRQPGTRHERTSDTLVFSKKNQAAQDKMSVFDGGVLRLERDARGPVLRYQLTSRALLFCFLAPLLFLGIAGFTSALGKIEASSPPGQASHAPAKPATKAKDADLPMNPIDKALGSPPPEKPGQAGKDKQGKKLSPTPAYVFAAIFVVLYVVGRILEDRLVKGLFKKSLLGS
jgi:hypothetical protein